MAPHSPPRPSSSHYADAGVRRWGRARKQVKTYAEEQAEHLQAAAPSTHQRKASTTENAIQDAPTAAQPRKAKITKKTAAVELEDAFAASESPPPSTAPNPKSTSRISNKGKQEATTYVDEYSQTPSPARSPQPPLHSLPLPTSKSPFTNAPAYHAKTPHDNPYLHNGAIVSELLDCDVGNSKRPLSHRCTRKPRKNPQGAICEVPGKQKKPTQWQREFKEKRGWMIVEDGVGEEGFWERKEVMP
ncbi:hypothetical protein Tdes44962_MAKER06273 [Teratosphaeria destructans]|uniref:Uncharacterized protein n=1 Tax=Teratosphaeria destructans TaxID=418781 RepID=A0A9W7VY23_9PEZI|nr:hypothetical protein Tdes44962_MAKER06273 [Teratosphaeria destructans]